MAEFNVTLIPKEKKENTDARYNKDKEQYLLGKSDAIKKLPRRSGVKSRDNQCYNMGYSTGEMS